MRISTNMIYDLGVSTINQQYSDLLKLQQQMSTGRRILTPSDDPIASARALQVSQSQSVNEQYIKNGDFAGSTLALQESVLGQVNELLQDVRVIAVNAGNPSLSDADRKTLASDLQGRYDQLLGLANSTDGEGQYLFSGFKSSTLPFTETSSGAVAYNGDQGQRMMQISASRQVAVSSSGAEVFQLIKNGNGTFVSAAGATNTGTGIVSPGVVVDPTKWSNTANSQDFSIVFDVDSTVVPSVTTYDIIDNDSGNSLLTGLAPAAAPYPRTFTSGGSIQFVSQGAEPAFDFGASLTISGQPADGDTFTVQASSTDQDIFGTMKDLIAALQTPVNTTASGNTRLTNKLNTALSDIDLAQDNLLTVRATVGANMREVEATQETGEDLSLQYKETLSDLRDLDYAKAISDMALKQVNLEAAQQSFLRIQGLSLFNFLS
jgi:flagellar hook-associated protein 3 FlgL